MCRVRSSVTIFSFPYVPRRVAAGSLQLSAKVFGTGPQFGPDRAGPGVFPDATRPWAGEINRRWPDTGCTRPPLAAGSVVVQGFRVVNLDPAQDVRRLNRRWVVSALQSESGPGCARSNGARPERRRGHRHSRRSGLGSLGWPSSRYRTGCSGRVFLRLAGATRISGVPSRVMVWAERLP
jgi:hypothetical protein